MLFFTEYFINKGIELTLNYDSDISGSFVTQTYDNFPLIDYQNNIEIGQIQFVNTNESITTNPIEYNITESITIQFKDGSAIFASNFYKSNNQFYNVGDKIIIPIISCTGNFVGRSGYIVIDVYVDKRNVTISIDC